MKDEKSTFMPTILAFIIIPLSGFATDIYLPSLPTIGAALKISTIQVQLTISLFLVTYGITQLFIGGVLDSFGRHRLCIGALLIFSLTSLTIANTVNIYLIYSMRIIHGIAVAIIIVSKRAFFVDVYSGEKLKVYLSIFTIIWSTGPIVAPFIGGYLQKVFGWESNFYFLAAFSLVLAVMEIIFSAETLKTRSVFSFQRITKIYVEMLKTPSFTLGLLMLGLAGSIVLLYSLTGPFIIEHHFSSTPIVAGYCSLVSGLAWMTGGIVGKLTVNRPFYKKIFINTVIQLLLVFTMLACLEYINGIFILIAFVYLIHCTGGFTYNNYFAFAMGKFPKNAGIAGGLSGGVSYIVMSLSSYGLVYLVPAKGPHNLSICYLILSLFSALVVFATYLMNRMRTS